MAEPNGAPHPAKRRRVDSENPGEPVEGDAAAKSEESASTSRFHAQEGLSLPSVPPPEAWDSSFFGVEPLDEFTSHVADWLYAKCKGRQNVEIEAKIGILVGMGQGNADRLTFPVDTETILHEPSSTRFESIMTLNQHRHYNRILNERVEQQKQPDYRGPRLRYEHTKEMDQFFALPGGQRLRVTTDATTGSLKPGGIIIKKRIDDLNVYSPKHAFDFRISVNTEDPAEMPNSTPVLTRNKDRVSYQYDMFKIDLTQVSDPPKDSNQGRELRHELEIEFLRPDILVYEGDLYRQQDPHSHFHHLVALFLNNIHMLIRNASAP